jgi:hypothetical protein
LSDSGENITRQYISSEMAYDSVRRDVLYHILNECDTPMKLVILIKMCLNENYSRVCIGKNLPHAFLIQNGLKQGDSLSPLFFNFSLEYEIRMVKDTQKGLELNGIHHLLVLADDNMLGENINKQKHKSSVRG